MEKDPSNKSSEQEGQKEEESNFTDYDSLTKMPPFSVMKSRGEIPEGIRDEQDYREYLEEKRAKEKAEQEASQEKIEAINTLEERLNLNENLYDRTAYSRALDFAAKKDDGFTTTNESIVDFMNNRLMDILYNGVVDENIDNLEKISMHDMVRDERYQGEENFVIQKNDKENIVNDYFSTSPRIRNQSMNDDEVLRRHPEYQEHHKLAKEMMNTDEYENDLDKFLNKAPEKITSYDIKDIEKEMRDLNYDSGGIFGYQHDLDGEYESIKLNPKNAVIPTLKSRLKLEEQILATKMKIAAIISDVKKREYQKDITRSSQGERVAKRLEKKRS